MYAISPNEQERYYLRIALLHIPGARGYNDLLTVGNTKCTSFREVCRLLGLLNDDAQWHNTMDEAASFQMPYQLRRLFITILTHCNPDDPSQLWMNHHKCLIEDHLLRHP